jgi:hypothetical protein
MYNALMNAHLAATALVLALPLQRAAAQNPVADIERVITQERIAAAVQFLSDDLLEGRGVGTRAEQLARLYLRTQMQTFGLLPGAADGTWEQEVPIVGATATVRAPLIVRGPKGEATFTAPDDYTAEAGRAEPTSEWRDAEIVFVGYGITAPEEQWDDYKGFDLRGKVALVMNDDPSSDPALFAGSTRLYYGRWSYKYEETARRGAVGAIVIHTRPSAGYPFHVIQSRQGKEEFALPPREGEPSLAIKSWCSEDAARRIAQLGGFDLDELRARAEKRDFAPVPLGVTADLATDNAVRELLSANVLAKIPGSDPRLRDQVVLITAHYDHLGIGQAKNDDTIYNGALDNASGTAMLLSIAQACAARAEAPRRTLLFAAVTAEESGLLGSRWLAQNPPVPVHQIVANFNIDGVNIWGATKDIGLIGYGKSSLTALAQEVAQRRGREVVPDAHPELGLFYRSDHFSFARVGVPSAYFKAGNEFFENKEGRNRVKDMYTTVHYHQPSDQYDDRWKLDGAVEDARLVLECMIRVAQADAQPTWTKGDEFEKLWQPARENDGAGGR